MKTQLTSIALSITIAFVSNSSSAANQKNWELHEKNWENVVSYSQTHVADDSAGEWGPWSEFAQPAAGTVIGFQAQSITDPYKPVPQIPDQPKTPDQPKLVTYSIYSNGLLQYSDDKEGAIEQFNPGSISVDSTFAEERGYWFTSWHIDPDTGKPVPNISDSGPLRGTYSSGIHTPNTPYLGSASNESNSVAIEVTPEFSEYVSVASLKKTEIVADYKTITNPATGNFVKNDEAGNPYIHSAGVTANSVQPVSCRGKCTWVETTPVTEENIQIGSHEVNNVIGYYLTGYTTPVSVMDTLRSANLIAQYAGSSVRGADVKIDVNFGTSSWNGTWTAGKAIAFDAKGSITGASIQGASTTAGVTGTVNGSFFGPTANSLAGRTDMTQGHLQTADLFVTTKQ